MTITFLHYPVQLGRLHHWLAAGPYGAGAAEQPSDLHPPVDLGPLAEGAPGAAWRYYAAQQDRWVSLSAANAQPGPLRGWAYTAVDSPQAARGQLALWAQGCAVEAWWNGSPVARLEQPAGLAAGSAAAAVDLAAGQNTLLLRLDTGGPGEGFLRAAAQITVDGGLQLQIALPTAIEPEFLDARRRLEVVAAAAYLDRYVYGFLGGDHYHKNEPVTVRYASELAEAGELTHRLQSPAGDIFQESTRYCGPSTTFDMAAAFPLWAEPHHLAILPPAKEYYVDKLQFERKELFYVLRSDFAAKPAPLDEDRRAQALEYAAQARGESVFTELARLRLGRGDKLNLRALRRAADRIERRGEGALADLLGVLGILLRYRQSLTEAGLRDRLRALAAGYPYGAAPAGEPEQIAQLTCEILAGQLRPRAAFAGSGQTGQWHRRRGEEQALAWMRQRGAYGFRHWDSPASMELTLAALAHLVDQAEAETVREMAAVLMDRIFFGMALHSWRGVYGASRGFADTPGVLSPRLEATSGISRLMWGLGNYNQHVAGVVSLALCEGYQLPPPVAGIAADLDSVVWARERSAAPDGSWEANRVTYRTPDFMLASAQDYAPGQPGAREHVWQASLGPDAIVYTNHPTNAQLESRREPNLWAGNGVLPRTAQWGDVLAAFYRLPDDDWMGYTHAYFPAHAFDAARIEDHWAFAQKGSAYLALYAANGLEWVQRGRTALRELISPGLRSAWVCHMGQAVLDGSFDDFQAKILAMDMQVSPDRAAFTSLRGDRIEVGWDGPLLVNGEAQATGGYGLTESPYCVAPLPATQMDIVYQGEGVRLRFD